MSIDEAPSSIKWGSNGSDGSEFVPDPDFLNKMNANMAMNDWWVLKDEEVKEEVLLDRGVSKWKL